MLKGMAALTPKIMIEPPPPLFLQKHTELDDCVTRLQQLHTEQQRAGEEIRGHVDVKVATLRRKRMMPLARIARPLLAYAPGAEEVLKVPHTRSDAATVATCALKMAEFLGSHAELLESAQVSREFLDEFRAEAAVLASVATRARDARQRRSAATQEIAKEIAKGTEALEVIQGLIMLHAPGELARWQAFKRTKPVGRPRKKRRRRPR